MTTRQRFTCALLFIASILSVPRAFAAADSRQESTGPAAHGTSPATNSRQVVIPALVYDKDLMNRPPSQMESQCVADDLEIFLHLDSRHPFIPKACDNVPIRGLKSDDFHVFENGIEEKINSVTVGNWGTTVRDNYGFHTEMSLTPAGKWSTPQLRGPILMSRMAEELEVALPRFFGLDEDGPIYWIAYTPSSPNTAGCRKLEVKVERAKARVFTWDESCPGQSPSDPLAGTKFGAQLEKEIASNNKGKLRLLIQTGALFSDDRKNPVEIALELPYQDVLQDWHMSNHKAIGLVGVAYAKDGVVAARFSDVVCCSSFAPLYGGSLPREKSAPDLGFALADVVADSVVPSRYETQINLPPGEYDLKVAFGDGERFGQAETPLVIHSHDGVNPGVSSILFCNRVQDADVAGIESAAANFATEYVPLVSKGKFVTEIEPLHTMPPTLSRRKEVEFPANMEFTPVGGTRLMRSELFVLYFEIYEPLVAEDPRVHVWAHIRLFDTKHNSLKDEFDLDAANFLRPGNCVIPMTHEISTNTLPKGTYRLEVQAKDSAGKSSAVRSAEFMIE